MRTKNETVIEKCKNASRHVLIKLGDVAAGNSSSDNIKRNIPIEPFTFPFLWPYEKKAPRRKGK